MKTLITGGAGFVGSHLATLLLERGHEVHLLDDLSTGRRENLDHIRSHPSLRLHEASVLDPGAVEPLVADCGEIYHLAAAVGVRLVIEKPVETIMTNVRGTEVVLDSALRHGKKVLVASTSEVYGKNKNGALREDDDRIMGSVTKQRWAYANTKTLDEFLALAYHRQYGLSVVITRLFNTVGPRQTGRYGMVIPNFVRAALDGAPLRVFGTGRQTRCFAYVGDVVRCLTDLMGHPGAVGQIFNIGNGHEISIAALAERVKALAGSSSPIKFIPYEEAYGEGFEDMERRVPDLTKVRDMVGYEPEVHLDEILRRVIAYFRENRSAS
ncbi:MAG: GDP-mannose 4,6-dehydratase [Candidatus Tectomicrobia bacterium]|nr:GDP-mannose 4,6-dehydratase [Candidatus Tectomicrobia bacterium]